MIDGEFLDYYKSYCELTIWFRKIVLHSNGNHLICVKDIAGAFIEERNRILALVPIERRAKLRRHLNKIAASYYDRITNWTRKQKTAIDMV